VTPGVAARPLLELSAIERRFDGGVVALDGVTIAVAAGEHVSIVGASGSGKSTLLNIVGLLDRPTAGSYHLDGWDCVALSERERAALRSQTIGFVFQAFHLLGYRTVEENVALPLLYAGIPRRERTDRAVAALERVGLGHRLGFLPTTLSGGERQRVAVARALVTAPRVLLCDEPTGNLDTATAGSILDLVAGLHDDGQTVIIVTHDEAVSRRGQRVIRMRDGRVVEDRDIEHGAVAGAP
jgi:putative ABC transport system ATP-binding protein